MKGFRSRPGEDPATSLASGHEGLKIAAKMNARSIVGPPHRHGLALYRNHQADSTLRCALHLGPDPERQALDRRSPERTGAEPIATFQAGQPNLVGAYEPTHQPHPRSYRQSEGKSPFHVKSAPFGV